MKPSTPPTEVPAAWFVELERARQAGNFARAAEARRGLPHLGVQVKYRPSSGRRWRVASEPTPPAPAIPALALRPKEAAAALGMSERSLWALTSDLTSGIPHVRLGKIILYPTATSRLGSPNVQRGSGDERKNPHNPTRPDPARHRPA